MPPPYQQQTMKNFQLHIKHLFRKKETDWVMGCLQYQSHYQSQNQYILVTNNIYDVIYYYDRYAIWLLAYYLSLYY